MPHPRFPDMLRADMASAHALPTADLGHPRRARVLLHGRFAGILEETSVRGATRFTYAATARRLALVRTDRFGMLVHAGGDVMGAVQVFPMEGG